MTGAKELRAQPFADQCEANNVRLVRGAWNYRFVEELCIFPAGDYDDQVDAASGAFSWCVRTPRFEAPSTAPRPLSPARFGIQFDFSRNWREMFRDIRR